MILNMKGIDNTNRSCLNRQNVMNLMKIDRLKEQKLNQHSVKINKLLKDPSFNLKDKDPDQYNSTFSLQQIKYSQVLTTTQLQTLHKFRYLLNRRNHSMYTLAYDQDLLRHQEQMESLNINSANYNKFAQSKVTLNELRTREFQEKMLMLVTLMGEQDKKQFNFRCPESCQEETTKSLDFAQQLPRSSSTDTITDCNSSTLEIETASLESDDSFYEEKDISYII